MSSLPYSGISSDDLAREMGLTDVGGTNVGTERESQQAGRSFLRQESRSTTGRRTSGRPSAPTGPEPPARNWRADVRLLFPWLPSAATRVVADKWSQTGDIQLGVAEMRSDPRYDRDWFPGNRRSDGTIRLGEQEYLSWIEGYTLDLSFYGLNPRVFRDRLPQLIEHGVSPDRFAQRLQAMHSEIWQNIDDVRQVYASYYGRGDLTREAVFAMAIDPQINEDILSRRITAAQVGGTAASFGFSRSAERAEELAAVGMGQDAAREFFSGAAQLLPRFQAFARRFADPDEDLSLREFEEAGVFGDPQQQQRLRRLSRSERSSFSPFGSIQEDQAGALRGLRPR